MRPAFDSASVFGRLLGSDAAAATAAQTIAWRALAAPLVDCLAIGGELSRAEPSFEQASSYANDLGLLSEDADPDRKELLGNYPQAFSHVGLINAAWRLTQIAERHEKDKL